MTIQDREVGCGGGGDAGEQDALASAAAVESSLAGLRARQMEHLCDFVVSYAGDTGVVALAGREQMVRYGVRGRRRFLSSPSRWSRPSWGCRRGRRRSWSPTP